MATRAGPNQTLREGLRLLEALAMHGGERRVSELARDLGLAKSQAYRLLRTLMAGGYVVQGADRRYRSDVKVLRLASAIVAEHPLRRSAQPYLHPLADTTGCAAVLSVMHENAALVIASEEPASAPLAEPFDILGRTAPLHASANGKVLLAWQPAAARAILLASLALPTLTARTCTDRAALARELAQARTRGWTANDGELADGHASLAVPVLDRFGRCHAALGLAFAQPRSTRGLLARLRRAAADIAAGAFRL